MSTTQTVGADEVRSAARAFLAEAFEALKEERVIPTARYHPHIRVGRDYFGDSVRGSALRSLERTLDAAYPARFSGEIALVDREFSSAYIFSLLEGAVARCSRAGIFDANRPEVDRSIDELLAVLNADEYEVACCRVVSHVATADGDPLQVGDVLVVPEQHGVREFEGLVDQWIPGGSAVFNRDPPFAYNPPTAMLVLKERASGRNPYDVVPRLTEKLERFLLHGRLLTGTTAQSFYEIAGPTTLVSPMRPHVTVPAGHLSSQVRRTLQLGGADAARFEAVARLVDEAQVHREGMVTTSFDTALRKFHGSHGDRNPYDQIVDLATALEAALVSTKKDAEGLSLRLRSRAAALLWARNDPASAIFNDITLLYDLRSNLVHGGELPEKELRKTISKVSTTPEGEADRFFAIALGCGVDRLRDLVRRAILARMCLAAGDQPLWPLRDSHPVDRLLADDKTRAVWRKRWRRVLREAGLAAAAEPQRPATDYFTTAAEH